MNLWRIYALRWRHNDHDGVSNHQPHGCLLNRLFRRRSKKTSKLRVTGLCVGNSPGPVNSAHKGPVTRKMFPFDDVIMASVNVAIIRSYYALSPSHYMNQSWLIVDFNLVRKFQRNLYQSAAIFLLEIELENVDCKMSTILFRLQWW